MCFFLNSANSLLNLDNSSSKYFRFFFIIIPPP
nr:MAG TPA: hypothetical protein [Caudoviricetes sp.]